MSEHLDLDALADVLAGASDSDHLASCEDCRARLAQLEHALPAVAASLAALPVPIEPTDLDARVSALLQAERSPGPATVVPLGARRSTRWLPALGAVAAAAALAVGTTVVLQQRDGGGSADGDGRTYALSSTGTDYTRDGKALRTALPALLEGGASTSAPEAGVLAAPLDSALPSPTFAQERTSAKADAADPLAALRTDAGLASCLVALGDPAEPEATLPLALDYASYEGQPALVVLLPTTKADKVDVFVVGAGCNQADAQLLFFTRLAKPA